MKIVPIINDPKPTLYTVRYHKEEKDVFDNAFDKWNDPEYLINFFEENSEDLENYNTFHGTRFTVNEAVLKTLKEAEEFEDLLYEIADLGTDDGSKALQDLFEPLKNYETEYYSMQSSKAKSSWLRLYAIRIDKNLYVVTGGCIKLTQKMNEREHTKLEREKIFQVKRFLENKGLVNKKAFEELELGI